LYCRNDDGWRVELYYLVTCLEMSRDV